MKKIQIAGLTALTLFGSLTSASAQSATTAPVGYVTLASEANPIPANTDVRLSVPMEASVDFTGVAASAAGTALTVTGASFTANEFAPATGGYYIRLKSGDSKGLTAEITANTTDTLTLALDAGDNLTNVDNTTQFEIVKYFTLSTFFPSDLANGVSVLFYNNTTAGVDIAADQIVTFFNGTWYDNVNGQPVDASLYPGETFTVRNNTNTPIENIVITGNVPTIAHRIVLTSLNNEQQDFALSYLSPVPELLANSSLGFTNGDMLLSYDRSVGKDKAASKILTFFNGSWYNNVNGQDETSSFKLEPGEGYVLRRAANSQGNTVWQTVQSYNSAP